MACWKYVLEFVGLLEMAVLFNVGVIWLLRRVLGISRENKRTVWLWLMSVLYAGVVGVATMFSREYYAVRVEFDAFRIVSYSFGLYRYLVQCFKLGKTIAPLNLAFYLRTINEGILNMLLFIPVGYYVLLWKNRKNGRKCGFIEAGALGLALSCIIEITQLLTHRGTFDFGDLLHNTMGAAAGRWLFLLVLEPYIKNTKAE